MVGLGRLELPTSPLSGVRSNQLSYRPIVYAATDSKLQEVALDVPKKVLAARLVAHSFSTAIYLGQAMRVSTYAGKSFSFKEVIQPQVPLGLPCYDFTPVMNHTVVTVLSKVRLATSGATHSHGVTGGVYKARERIHRNILICDY